MKPLPLALRQRAFRREPRVVDVPVSRAEKQFLLSMERQGVDRETLFRVALPLARAGVLVVRAHLEGDRLVRYLLEKAKSEFVYTPPTGGQP